MALEIKFTNEELVLKQEQLKEQTEADYTKIIQQEKLLSNDLEKTIKQIDANEKNYQEKYQKNVADLKQKNGDDLKKIEEDYLAAIASAKSASQEKLNQLNQSLILREEQLRLTQLKLADTLQTNLNQLAIAQKENTKLADNNDAAEKKRYDNLCKELTKNAQNQIASFDDVLNQMKLKFQEDIETLNLELKEIERKYLDEQNQKNTANRLATKAIDDAEAKFVNDSKLQINKLTENFNTEKSNIEKKIKKAGENKKDIAMLNKELKLKAAQLDKDIKNINKQIVILNKKNNATKALDKKNLATALEQLRLLYVADIIVNEEKQKTVELEHEREIFEKEVNRINLLNAISLDKLQKENRVELLVNANNRENSLANDQLNQLKEKQGNILAVAYADFDFMLDKIENKYQKSIEEISASQNLKELESKYLIDVEAIAFKTDQLLFEFEKNSKIHNETSNNQILIKQETALKNYQTYIDTLQQKNGKYQIDKGELENNAFLLIQQFKQDNFVTKLQLILSQQKEQYQSTRELIEAIYNRELAQRNQNAKFAKSINDEALKISEAMLAQLEARKDAQLKALEQLNDCIINQLNQRIEQENASSQLAVAILEDYAAKLGQSIDQFDNQNQDLVNKSINDCESTIANLNQQLEAIINEINNQYQTKVDQRNDQNHKLLAKINNELSSFIANCEQQKAAALSLKESKIADVNQQRATKENQHNQTIAAKEQQNQELLVKLNNNLDSLKVVFTNEIAALNFKIANDSNQVELMIVSNTKEHLTKLKVMKTLIKKKHKQLVKNKQQNDK